MKATPWPMNTSSSMVTPSQMKVWLEILQRFPTLAFFWISTNAPILVSSPISHPYRLMNLESLTSRPSLTSGAIHTKASIVLFPSIPEYYFDDGTMSSHETRQGKLDGCNRGGLRNNYVGARSFT